MYVDRSSWGRVHVTGDDRVRFLHGLSTVNVETIAAGGNAWGAFLSPKGRVLSIVNVARFDDHLVVASEPSLAAATLAHLERYAVMDDVLFTSQTGPAFAVWPDTAAVWTSPIVDGAAPAPLASAEDEETRRIEAGWPRYGTDVSDENFPFETPLAERLDYAKGCYIGQEPVFRVHAQGQTARSLRGLQFAPGADLAGLTVGAVVAHDKRPEAGKLTSVTQSPRLGPIALAYLHRTASAIGDAVTVNGQPATIVGLPFP